jgi:hypothetical protein
MWDTFSEERTDLSAHKTALVFYMLLYVKSVFVYNTYKGFVSPDPVRQIVPYRG